MLGCLGLGATFVHAGHFDPLVSLHQLQDERCTVAYPAFDLIWLARARPSPLPGVRPQQAEARPEHHDARTYARPPAAHAVGEVRHLVRGDGVLEQPDPRRRRRRRADAHRHARHARPRYGAEDRRPGDRGGAGTRRDRRAVPARVRDVRGLLQGSRADGPGSRRGRLVPHRRPGLAGRATAVSPTRAG